ncbi:MAG: hypothetical protein IT265_06070 [Saprospiraceae bacterium]|nr:hypothetical protein [Saprospiraceae bacterium]
MPLFEDKTVYWVIITSFVMPVLFGIGLIWFLLKFQKRKHQTELEKKDLLLREQQLIIDNQTAIETERTRIASEMHDDLGSGLTTIRYLSDRALKNVSTDEEKTQIAKIAEQSSALVRNMSEIIWAMNSRYDTVDNLVAYIRHYTSEFLEAHHIDSEWHQGEWVGELKLNGEKRRNVFLVIKETLHNIVKHAKASKVSISINYERPNVLMHIVDNGIGFDPNHFESMGNGLFNMQQRMSKIHGKLDLLSTNEGTEIMVSFPLEDQLTEEAKSQLRIT